MENNNKTAEEEEMDFDTLIPESNPITLGLRTFLKASASEEDKETLIPDEETPAEATEEVLDETLVEQVDEIPDLTPLEDTEEKGENPSETKAPNTKASYFEPNCSTQSSEDLFAPTASQDWKEDGEPIPEPEPEHVPESDDDMFESTPQKSPPKKKWRPNRSRLTSGDFETKGDDNDTLVNDNSKPLEIPQHERDEMVLVCSGLKTDSDRKLFQKFIAKFGLRQKNTIDNNVSHLVVNVNSENCADRTLKFLQAITKRCWIVSLTWIKECMSQSILLYPDFYEVLDTNGRSGPNQSRLSPRTSKLFQGYEICLTGAFGCIAKDDLVSLLKDEGAQIARSVNSMTFKKKGIIVVDNSDSLTVKRDAEKNLKAYQLVTVTKHWAMDSLSSFEIKSVFEDIVYENSKDEILKFGYV